MYESKEELKATRQTNRTMTDYSETLETRFHCPSPAEDAGSRAAPQMGLTALVIPPPMDPNMERKLNYFSGQTLNTPWSDAFMKGRGGNTLKTF